MDKMLIFTLSIFSILYLLTAAELLKSLEKIISKHPLFIYSVIVLALLVLSFKVTGKARYILMWIFIFFLSVYYLVIRGK